MAQVNPVPALYNGKVDLTDELQWIRKPQQYSDGVYKSYVPPETFKEKVVRKTKANPLVPFGIFLTTAALSYGLYAMRTGNAKLSQNMMRARVMAQGFTIVALVGGVLIAGSNAK